MDSSTGLFYRKRITPLTMKSGPHLIPQSTLLLAHNASRGEALPANMEQSRSSTSSRLGGGGGGFPPSNCMAGQLVLNMARSIPNAHSTNPSWSCGACPACCASQSPVRGSPCSSGDVSYPTSIDRPPSSPCDHGTSPRAMITPPQAGAPPCAAMPNGLAMSLQK
jgi:hypothetical protein